MIRLLAETVSKMALSLARGSRGLGPVPRLGLQAVVYVGAFLTVSSAWSLQSFGCPSWNGMSEDDREKFFQRMSAERGFTILLRRADKLGEDRMGRKIDRTVPTTEIDKSQCENYKNRLNDHGVEQAEFLNAVFEELGDRYVVRINGVLSSNSCRALETARIAFGEQAVRTAKDKNLTTANKNGSLSERLREDIGDTNRVLVTHSGEIKRALIDIGVGNGELGCAEAAVLRIETGDTRPSCLARILPEEWLDRSSSSLSRTLRSHTSYIETVVPARARRGAMTSAGSQ